MNLLMASVFLLAMLAFQPTLIYGSKKNLALVRTANANGGAVNRNARSAKYGKRHSIESPVHPLYSPALSSTAKLVLSMDSGDEVLVRAARGASVDNNKANPASTPTGISGTGTGTTVGKRQKGNNNRKLNKNLSTHENGAAASSPSSSSSSAGRKHLEKKFSAASGGSNVSPHQQQQQASNGKGKQRQILKSHNHQGKRNGNNGNNGNGKAIRENADPLHGQSEKSPSCRYSKSAWTECDTKTNMRSRTLNLKKGDSSCQPTRTMLKKCKKSCRYEKGAWSECINGQMTREDKLKATGGAVGAEPSLPSSCEPLRSINKKCNPNNGAGSRSNSNGKLASGSGGSKKERKNKDKGSRRNQSQQQQQPQ